jgi:hypothetical protein
MASDLKTMEGAAILAMLLKALIIVWASGRFSQSVPMRFQINATASRRNTSTPWLARKSISPAMDLNTSEFA